MRNFFSILLSLCLISFVGCTTTENKTTSEKCNIPSLEVAYEGENLSVEKGGYSWDTGKVSINADSASPDQIADKMAGDRIKPQGHLILNFSENPNKVSVVDWSESKNGSFNFDNAKIVVPKEEGTYIYEIIGHWKQGQVSFTIKVIVSND